jgi:cytochrome c oxidase subunit 4
MEAPDTIAAAARPHERPHPGARQYLGIAAALVVLTVMEVGIYYMPAMKPALIPSLLVLAGLKFTLVAMFYMHLRFDARLFSALFVVPLCVAAAVTLILLRLFAHP